MALLIVAVPLLSVIRSADVQVEAVLEVQVPRPIRQLETEAYVPPLDL
jgi:hypothetical protein